MAKKVDPTWSAIRLLAQTDLFVLAKTLLGYRDLTESFHRPICEWAQTTPFATNLSMVQRGAFKTSILTVARNVQRILRTPQIRILIASNKAENSEAMLREIKGHLTNPQLVHYFPDVLYQNAPAQAERWTNSAITVKRARVSGVSTIETVGVEGELTSKHYDHGTFDDIVGYENSQTREQLLHTRTWWRTAQSLFDPGATQDVIGTPWHYADIYAWLQQQKAKHGMPLGVYKRPCWEAVAGALVATFPERFPIPVLLRLKAEIGSAMFAAQYLLDPTDDETAVFPRAKMQGQVRRREDLPDPATLWLAMTVDPAISVKSWADYSALAVGGFDRDGVLYIYDLRRGRWSESDLIAQMYSAWSRTPGIRAIGFEAVSFAKIFRRLITAEGERRGAYLPIVGLERDTKTTKAIRIRSLQPYWENHSLVLAEDLPALDDFLDEAERFRLDKESAHDDMLDAMADLLQLRVRPAEVKPEQNWSDDPDIQERLEFERWALREKPKLDRTSLRVAWSMHRRRQESEKLRELAAVGAEPDEFWR